MVLSNLAHRCAALGYAGLEWAANVPGTVGGAVYGNAGAFGSDIAHNLKRAEILTPTGVEWWTVEQLEFGYRSSLLKQMQLYPHTNGGAIPGRTPAIVVQGKAVILSAEFFLSTGSKEQIQGKIDEFTSKRKASQPAGASMGSMFKNPIGDFAGRLIESAGLKGTRIGNAEISSVHANFMINHGQTRAEDVRALIKLAQNSVKEKFGVNLELEIEIIGEWQ